MRLILGSINQLLLQGTLLALLMMTTQIALICRGGLWRGPHLLEALLPQVGKAEPTAIESLHQYVNLSDASSNDWYITGVQLGVGETATPFEHEDYGTTLAKCQRYFVRLIDDALYSDICNVSLGQQQTLESCISGTMRQHKLCQVVVHFRHCD